MNITVGFDLGTKTLGIAYIDELGYVRGKEVFEFPYLAYSRAKKRAIEVIEQLKAVDVVLGLPLNMDGSESKMSNASRIFGSRLKTSLPSINLILQDERLSSVAASELMIEAGLKKEERKKYIDMFAAIAILKSYLSKKN